MPGNSLISVFYDKAIKIAKENARHLLGDIDDLTLEGVTTNRTYYKVSLSYYRDSNNNSFDRKETKNRTHNRNFENIISLLGRRRETKIFLVNKKTLEFSGFENRDQID